MGRLLFITGLSGAGKTTLGEKLKANNGFLHFNVDVWAFGGDAIVESGSVPDPVMIAKRDSVVKEAFDNMIAQGFQKLSAGETTEFAVWETFFGLLCPAVLAARDAQPDKDLVVSFSVYLRSVRDYIRQQLGNNLAFVVLNPDIEKVAARKVDHLRNTASQRGLTLSQFLRSFHPDSDAPELEENIIVDLLKNQARSGARGFEAAAEEEPRTLSVADMSAEEAHQTVLSFFEKL